MYHCVAFILLSYVGKIIADGSPLLTASLLKTDIESAISIYKLTSIKFDPSGKPNGFIQYLSYELFVQREAPKLFITCAEENRKCRYYETVTQTWVETRSNKICFDGENFFDTHEGIRTYFENDFMLLLTMQKKNRKLEDHSFMIIYKNLEEFQREDADVQDNELMDLKTLYVTDIVQARVGTHPVLQAKMMLDSKFRKERGGLIIKSSAGIFRYNSFLGLRRLIHFEYAFRYSQQYYRREIDPVSVTPHIIKYDLASLDPLNQCEKKKADVVGFLEYQKNLLRDVRCVDKQYSIEAIVKRDGKQFEAVITCPREINYYNKWRCTMETDSKKLCAKKKKLNNDDRLLLIPKRLSGPSFEAVVIETTAHVFPMVHYFQLNNHFKQKLLAMQKLLNFYCVGGSTMTFLVPSFGRRDFTVPIKFGCRDGRDLEIGRGDLLVFDDNSMIHLTIHKLLFKLETEEFQSPDARFQRGNTKAIRFVGSWRKEPIPKILAKSDIPLHYIMEDLKILRDEYLDEAASNPEAKKALKINEDILLVMHGEEVIEGRRAVLIQAQIICMYSIFNSVYFTGEQLLAYNNINYDKEIIDPKECKLMNKKVVTEDQSYVEGVTYLTEDGLAKFIDTFTQTILNRCQWYATDTVFRGVLHTADRRPLIEALYHCSVNIYLLRGPFQVLSESKSKEVVENVFVFVKEDVLVTTTDAYVVKVFGVGSRSRPIRGIDSMGPILKVTNDWSITLQELST